MKKYTISLLFVGILFIVPIFTQAQSDVDTSGEESCAVLSTNLRYSARDNVPYGTPVLGALDSGVERSALTANVLESIKLILEEMTKLLR